MTRKWGDAVSKGRRANLIKLHGGEDAYWRRQEELEDWKSERKGSNAGTWVERPDTIPPERWECPHCKAYFVLAGKECGFPEEDWHCTWCGKDGSWTEIINYSVSQGSHAFGMYSFYQELATKARLVYRQEKREEQDEAGKEKG